jgi:hypothetical protein
VLEGELRLELGLRAIKEKGSASRRPKHHGRMQGPTFSSANLAP